MKQKTKWNLLVHFILPFSNDNLLVRQNFHNCIRAWMSWDRIQKKRKKNSDNDGKDWHSFIPGLYMYLQTIHCHRCVKMLKWRLFSAFNSSSSLSCSCAPQESNVIFNGIWKRFFQFIFISDDSTNLSHSLSIACRYFGSSEHFHEQFHILFRKGSKHETIESKKPHTWNCASSRYFIMIVR